MPNCPALPAAPPLLPQGGNGLGQGELLAPEAGHETAAAHLAAVLQAAVREWADDAEFDDEFVEGETTVDFDDPDAVVDDLDAR